MSICVYLYQTDMRLTFVPNMLLSLWNCFHLELHQLRLLRNSFLNLNGYACICILSIKWRYTISLYKTRKKTRYIGQNIKQKMKTDVNCVVLNQSPFLCFRKWGQYNFSLHWVEICFSSCQLRYSAGYYVLQSPCFSSNWIITSMWSVVVYCCVFRRVYCQTKLEGQIQENKCYF